MKNKERLIMRGDIFNYDFGKSSTGMQRGKRPVVVLQSDELNAISPTILVAVITSAFKKQFLPSHIILDECFGLNHSAMVMVEEIATINKSELKEFVGFIDDEDVWKEINIALKKTFGLWVYKKVDPKNIRCLCPSCLRDYKNNPDYIVKRLDPYAEEMDRCDRCNNFGWDYIVYDRTEGVNEKD